MARAIELRPSESGETQPGSAGQSVPVVFGRLV